MKCLYATSQPAIVWSMLSSLEAEMMPAEHNLTSSTSDTPNNQKALTGGLGTNQPTGLRFLLTTLRVSGYCNLRPTSNSFTLSSRLKKTSNISSNFRGQLCANAYTREISSCPSDIGQQWKYWGGYSWVSAGDSLLIKDEEGMFISTPFL